MDLIDLGSGSTIRLERSLRNLEKSLIDIDLIKVRLIEFIT
jgi:hypothetical protein